MTREEALYWLKDLAERSREKDMPKYTEAIDMAISALQTREHYDKALERLFEIYDTIEEALNVKLTEQVTSKLKNPCDSLLTEDSEDSKEQKSKLEPSDIPMFAEAEEAYKEWTGEDMCATNHENEQNCGDLISRADLIDAIEETDWYSPNRKGELTHGAKDESEAWYKYEDIYKAINKVPSVSAPQGDLISRTDVLGYIDRLDTCGLGKGKALEYIRKYVEKTDSVSAEKHGEWIVSNNGKYQTCSECGIEMFHSNWNYCPHCGARMENKK